MINKNVMISMGVLALFLSSGLSVAGMNTNTYEKYSDAESEPTPYDEPVWIQVRNQIRDMLGIGDGDGECDEELVELSGIIITDGKYYYIENIKVSFGPLWYITTTTSSEDYDNDGKLELINEELNGLVDTEITLEGFYQSEQWFSAFTINSLFYRSVGRPIWSNGNGGN